MRRIFIIFNFIFCLVIFIIRKCWFFFIKVIKRGTISHCSYHSRISQSANISKSKHQIWSFSFKRFFANTIIGFIIHKGLTFPEFIKCYTYLQQPLWALANRWTVPKNSYPANEGEPDALQERFFASNQGFEVSFQQIWPMLSLIFLHHDYL